MRPNFTAGQLIKMGKFKDAIPLIGIETKQALDADVITQNELLELMQHVMKIMLNPADFNYVQEVGDYLLKLATRIPGYLTPVDKKTFYDNIKLDYEIIQTDD